MKITRFLISLPANIATDASTLTLTDGSSVEVPRAVTVTWGPDPAEYASRLNTALAEFVPFGNMLSVKAAAVNENTVIMSIQYESEINGDLITLTCDEPTVLIDAIIGEIETVEANADYAALEVENASLRTHRLLLGALAVFALLK